MSFKSDNNENDGIGFFDKYLTLWVVLCMIAGIMIGKFLPVAPSFLGKLEYAQLSLPKCAVFFNLHCPLSGYFYLILL